MSKLPPPTPPEPRPFVPRITGELRKRLFKYSTARGRSAAGAVRWLLHRHTKRHHWRIRELEERVDMHLRRLLDLEFFQKEQAKVNAKADNLMSAERHCVSQMGRLMEELRCRIPLPERPARVALPDVAKVIEDRRAK